MRKEEDDHVRTQIRRQRQPAGGVTVSAGIVEFTPEALPRFALKADVLDPDALHRIRVNYRRDDGDHQAYKKGGQER